MISDFNPIPITNDKYKDLVSLCNSMIIPSNYHMFYKSLSHGNVNNNDESE